MTNTIQAMQSATELPARDVDALLGFRFDIANGRSVVVNPTRASSTNRRQAPRFCRHGVGR